MPNFECNRSLSEYLESLNPLVNPASLVNDQYDSTYYDDWNRGPYTINFYLAGVATDFSKWYKPGTMMIESVDGFEAGMCSFEIWDVHPDHFNLPFRFAANMEIKIGNQNGTDWFFRGRVQDVIPLHYNRRTDGTESRKFKVVCLDMKVDFKRWLVRETFEDMTTYAIIKQIVRDYTPFDESLIDETQGFKLTSYNVAERFPADVIQELLDLEVTTTITLDPDTLQVKLGNVQDPDFNFLTVTDTDINAESYVYNYFLPEDFALSSQNLILRNRVVFWFNGSYSTGTIAVSNGGRTVIGTGTKWKNLVRKGGKFDIEGDTALYTVEDVNSNTDIRLTQVVNRTTATGITYRAHSYRDRIIVDDVNSIATMAAILGESFERAGVFEVKMPERSGPMTRQQARSLAQAYVNRMIQNLIMRGQARSKNYKINVPGLQAGWTITFELELTRNFNAVVKVQKLTMLDKNGGNVDRTLDPLKGWYDGSRIDPIHELIFEFTDRRLLRDAVIERLLQDVREVQMNDDEIVELVGSARELMLVADCVHLAPKHGPNAEDPNSTGPEECEVSDEADVTTVDPSLGYVYMAPAGVGHSEGYMAALGGPYAFMAA